MSTPLVQFKVDTSGAEAKFRGKSDEIRDALAERTTAINTALQAKIAGPILHGEVLKSHTGKLAGSIRVMPTVVSTDQISGGVQAGGGPAYYAEDLEDGVDHSWVIQAKNGKALAFFPTGSMGAGAAGPLTAAQDAIGRGGLAKLLKAKSTPNVFGPLTKRRAALLKKAGVAGGAFGMVFVQKVTHPAQEATLFMKGTLAAEQENIIASYQQAVNEVVG